MVDLSPDLTGPALLTHLRSRAGLGLRELARRAEVSAGMVAQVEGGERRPSRKLLAKVSAALGIEAAAENRLLVAFGFTPESDTPEQIAAFLRADKNLAPGEAEALARLVRYAYEQMRRGREGAVGAPGPAGPAASPGPDPWDGTLRAGDPDPMDPVD